MIETWKEYRRQTLEWVTGEEDERYRMRQALVTLRSGVALQLDSGESTRDVLAWVDEVVNAAVPPTGR